MKAMRPVFSRLIGIDILYVISPGNHTGYVSLVDNGSNAKDDIVSGLPGFGGQGVLATYPMFIMVGCRICQKSGKAV